MSSRLLRVIFTFGTFAMLTVGAGASARAEPATTRHLLAGVHAFQDGRYEDALVELRVVARASDAPADLAFYLGPTLYKLARYREALTVFLTSPAARDELSDFYLAETYYQLGMYRKARALFVGLRGRSVGPVLDAAAARHVAAVDAVYQAPVGPAVIDAYIAQASERVGTDPLLAGELLDEARQVEALFAGGHRHHEILAALGAAWNASGQARAVVTVLASEPALAPAAAWQLARGYLAVGDRDRARPLLETLAKGAGRNARDAANLLAAPAP